MKIIINPEYQKLVPQLSAEEYRALKESIKENNGIWLPIICNPQGVILDGHHRFKACHELKIKAIYAERAFENKLLEKKFVIESNLKRRQLNDFQKTELGIPLLEIERQLAAQRQMDAGDSKPLAPDDAKGKSTDIVAKKIGVSGTTFERAKKIIEKAPEEIKKKLRAHDPNTSISKEYKNIIKAEKKEKRQEQIRQQQVKLPEKVTLHNSEFQKTYIEGGSVSLIITDPLYHEKDLQVYADLAVHASRVLRDGGSLLCYAGHFAIDRIISMVQSHGLKFQHPMVILHGGPTRALYGKKVMVGYMPLLWFVKGKYDGGMVRDVVQSEFQGNDIHPWAKSTAESDYYIEHMTIPGEIVYDPFLGQGTFGVSAIKLNRQFIGCEINPEHFENAQKILSSVTPQVPEK